MNVSLTPQLKRFVEHKVKNGQYENTDDVVRDALRLLEDRDRLVATLPSLTGLDIEALAYIVLMQAARDAEEDLKEIISEIESINKAKRELRKLVEKIKHDISNSTGQKRPKYDSNGLGSERAYHRAPIPVPDPGQKGGVRFLQTDLFTGRIADVAILESIRNDLRDRLESMDELSEITSLRLQLVVDRRSKFLSTLSNILKKISCTQDSIVQNLK